MDASIKAPIFTKKTRAANGTRTRDLQLGKLKLYQLSYCRIFYEEFPIANVIVILHINKLNTQFYD